MNNIDRVREFTVAFKGFLNETPRLDNVSDELAFLRFKITREEVEELYNAIIKNDRKEILDALIDIQYLTDGTYLTYGLPKHCRDSEGFFNVWTHEDDEPLRISEPNELEYFMPLNTPMSVCCHFDILLAAFLESHTQKELQAIHLSLLGMTECIKSAFDFFNFSWRVIEAASKEVHNSNMSKLDENGQPIFREDGKVLKGPNYFRPDLQKIINEYEV